MFVADGTPWNLREVQGGACLNRCQVCLLVGRNTAQQGTNSSTDIHKLTSLQQRNQ